MRNKIKWSPVEEAYLTKHKDDPKDQLCIALAKSRGALDKKLDELALGAKKKSKRVLPKGKQSYAGKRPDLGIFLRSAWEANMMRIFKTGSIGYMNPQYEPFIFSFVQWEKPRGQALSYTPDFKVFTSKQDFWVEVKGNWLRAADKTKLRRFKKYYPQEFAKLIVVVSSKNTKTAKFFKELGVLDNYIIEYNDMKKRFSGLPNWEG